MTKRCSKCKVVKPKEMFSKSSTSKSGCSSQCKVCIKEARDAPDTQVRLKAKRKLHYEANKEATLAAQKADRDNNPEKYKEREAKKYIKNKDKILARVLEYQKANPDVYRKAGKKYRASTPDKQCAKAAKRRAKRLQATPPWTLDDEWEQFYLSEIYHLSSLRTAMLKEMYNVDHAVPLVSSKVCGLHVSCNLQILKGAENSAKRNHYWPDMWLDSDFPQTLQ